MIDLILWNSVASRRRSPGDTFLENGLALIQTELTARGFEVEVLDWARPRVWQSFTPRTLARLCAVLAATLVPEPGSNDSRGGLWRKILLPFFLALQELMSLIQKRRQHRMIRSLAEHVRDSGCRVLGIKTWYGEAFSAARYLADRVRRLAPWVFIVAGGPHASVYREALLEGTEFDLVVAGCGEGPLTAVLELARQGHDRASLLALAAAATRHGELGNSVLRYSGTLVKSPPEQPDTATGKAIPVYSDSNDKTMIHVVVDSLGCPWGQCSFCVHSRIYPTHSLRPPAEIVDEMRRMLDRGIGIFRFAGSSTTLHQALETARLITGSGLKLEFSMFARCESGAVRPEIYSRAVESYRTLISAGLRAVFLGAESGSDTANRNVMNKGLLRADLVATVRAMREAARLENLPLDIGLSLIYPAPTLGGFGLEELAADNISLVEEVRPDSVLISPPAPFPGTAWFDQSTRYGFELGERFIQEMLEYDYVLYKPPSLWPDLGLRLEGRDLRHILAECQSLRQALEARGFTTEVTDEHFLMLRAAGYEGAAGVARFKRQALLGLLSCDYRWMSSLQETVNRKSREIAALNDLQTAEPLRPGEMTE